MVELMKMSEVVELGKCFYRWKSVELRKMSDVEFCKYFIGGRVVKLWKMSEVVEFGKYFYRVMGDKKVA